MLLDPEGLKIWESSVVGLGLFINQLQTNLNKFKIAEEEYMTNTMGTPGSRSMLFDVGVLGGKDQPFKKSLPVPNSEIYECNEIKQSAAGTGVYSLITQDILNEQIPSGKTAPPATSQRPKDNIALPRSKKFGLYELKFYVEICFLFAGRPDKSIIARLIRTQVFTQGDIMGHHPLASVFYSAQREFGNSLIDLYYDYTSVQGPKDEKPSAGRRRRRSRGKHTANDIGLPTSNVGHSTGTRWLYGKDEKAATTWEFYNPGRFALNDDAAAHSVNNYIKARVIRHGKKLVLQFTWKNSKFVDFEALARRSNSPSAKNDTIDLAAASDNWNSVDEFIKSINSSLLWLRSSAKNANNYLKGMEEITEEAGGSRSWKKKAHADAEKHLGFYNKYNADMVNLLSDLIDSAAHLKGGFVASRGTVIKIKKLLSLLKTFDKTWDRIERAKLFSVTSTQPALGKKKK